MDWSLLTKSQEEKNKQRGTFQGTSYLAPFWEYEGPEINQSSHLFQFTIHQLAWGHWVLALCLCTPKTVGEPALNSSNQTTTQNCDIEL